MRAFYKEARQDTLLPIVYAEYFIDQDPGFNNGITIPVASDSAYQDLVFSIDIDSLAEGFHKLFLRTRDAKGKWSMTTFQPFFKQIFRILWVRSLPLSTSTTLILGREMVYPFR